MHVSRERFGLTRVGGSAADAVFSSHAVVGIRLNAHGQNN
jgi:hypothetical protein